MEKPFIDKTKLPEVMDIIGQAASLMEEKDCNNDDKAKKELSVFQKRLGDITGNKEINITDFREYWGYTSLEEIAYSALMPPPPRKKLNDSQILEIILNILPDNNGDETSSKAITSEAEMDYWIKYLTVNTGLENLSDYIFYPDLAGLGRDASIREIADKIIADRKL